MITTRWCAVLGAAEHDAVAVLTDEVAAADGVAAFSESVLLDLAAPLAPREDVVRHLLVHSGDTLVGYAHVDRTRPEDPVVEMAVHPAHRRGGIGTTMADAARDTVPTARAWAHGDHPAAARLATRAGLRRARELWEMRRPRSAGALPPLAHPDGVVIGALRVGVDEPAVRDVNNRAFAWHPEQSGWTLDDIAEIEAQPWFDPAGVLLAWDGSQPGDGTLLGFHWTKVHEVAAGVPEPLGEVYVIGIDPSAQGRGLGRALTLAGLHHLAGRGLDEVILYVEGDNVAGIATYRGLGFERDGIDVSYQR